MISVKAVVPDVLQRFLSGVAVEPPAQGELLHWLVSDPALTGEDGVVDLVDGAVAVEYQSANAVVYDGSTSYSDLGTVPGFTGDYIKIWFHNDVELNSSIPSGSQQCLLGDRAVTGKALIGGPSSGGYPDESLALTHGGTQGASYIKDAIPIGDHILELVWTTDQYEFILDGSPVTTYKYNTPLKISDWDFILGSRWASGPSLPFQGTISAIQFDDLFIPLQEGAGDTTYAPTNQAPDATYQGVTALTNITAESDYIQAPYVVENPVNGDLQCYYREATNHYGSFDGRTMRIVSSDGGATWGSPQTIFAAGTGGSKDLRNFIVKVLSNGTYVGFQATYEDHGAGDVTTTYVQTSTDQGLTWSARVALGTNPLTSNWGLGGAPVELANGDVLAAIWDWRGGSGSGVYITRSNISDLTTWSDPVSINSSTGANESTLILFDDGEIRCLSRIETANTREIVSSTDNGLTWSAPVTANYSTPIFTCRPDLLKISDDYIISNNRLNSSSWATTFHYSTDRGLNWTQVTTDITSSYKNQYTTFINKGGNFLALVCLEVSASLGRMDVVDLNLLASEDHITVDHVSTTWGTAANPHSHIEYGFTRYTHATQDDILVVNSAAGDSLVIDIPAGYSKASEHQAQQHQNRAESLVSIPDISKLFSISGYDAHPSGQENIWLKWKNVDGACHVVEALVYSRALTTEEANQMVQYIGTGGGCGSIAPF